MDGIQVIIYGNFNPARTFMLPHQDLRNDFDKAAAESEETPAPSQVFEDPPEQLSKSAVDKRLRRVMQPRADGSLLVPQELKAQWKDPLTRDTVLALFEKCAYKPDSFEKVLLAGRISKCKGSHDPR